MEAGGVAAPRAVRIIELAEDGSPKYKGLLIVEVGTRLVFSMRPNTRVSMDGLAIWTNCPVFSDVSFERHIFTALEGSDTGYNLNGDWHTYVDISRPGCFEFFAEFEKYSDGTQIALSPKARPAEAGNSSSSETSAIASTSGFEGAGLAVAARRGRRNSIILKGQVVPPPAPTRRGPIVRFVVQPELSIRLLRPVLPPGEQAGVSSLGLELLAAAPTGSEHRSSRDRGGSQGGEGPGMLLLDGTNAAPARPAGASAGSAHARPASASSSGSQPLSNGRGGSRAVPVNTGSSGSSPGEAGTDEGDLHVDTDDVASTDDEEEDDDGELDDEDEMLGSDDDEEVNASDSASQQHGRDDRRRSRAGKGARRSRARDSQQQPSGTSAAAATSPHDTSYNSDHLPPVDVHASISSVLPGLALQPGLHHEEALLPLPLEGITLQTQLVRCLGPIDSWLRYVDIKQAAAAADAGMPGALPQGLGVVQQYGPSQASIDQGPPSDLVPASTVVVGSLAEPLACKFNFLHFTPVQRLGGSNSCYSLADQLCLEWETFAGNAAVNAAAARVLKDCGGWANNSTTVAAAADGKEQQLVGGLPRSEAEYRLWSHPVVEGSKMAVLRAMVRALEGHHGVLSMVDVVLNHTSTDSPWLRSHPEAGYSLRNSPHLRAAFELDEAVLRVSEAIRTGKVSNVGPSMHDDGAVNAAVDVLQYHSQVGLPASRLWEFYICDTLGAVAAAAAMLPGIDLDGDVVASLTQADNVEGGDKEKHQTPAPLHSTGVLEQTLAEDRRLEIAAARHPVIKAVLKCFSECGYGSGSSQGQGAVPVSDHDIARLASQLAEQSPPPPVDVAVSRLRAGTAALRAGRDLGYGGAAAGHPGAAACASTSVDGGVAGPRGKDGGSTPIATPVPAPASSPSEQLPSPQVRAADNSSSATGGYPGGRPPTGPSDTQAPSQMQVDTSSSAGAHRPSGAASGDGSGGIKSPYYHRPGAFSGRHGRILSGRGGGREVTQDGTAGYRSPTYFSSSGSTSGPHSPAASCTGAVHGDGNAFRGGAYNDGTGARFPVHLDLELAVSALNSLPGVKVDPEDWTWPGINDAASSASAAASSPNRGGSNISSGHDAATFTTEALQPGPGAGSASASGTSLGLLPSLQLLHRLACAVNAQLYKRYDSDIGSALNAIRGTAKYTWLSQWGGRESIEPDRPIVYSYFTRVVAEASGASASDAANDAVGLQPQQSSPSSSAAAKSVHVLACNGFIWNGDPEIDFTLPVDTARQYADLVRYGTAEVKYVKRRSTPVEAQHQPQSHRGVVAHGDADVNLRTPTRLRRGPGNASFTQRPEDWHFKPDAENGVGGQPEQRVDGVGQAVDGGVDASAAQPSPVPFLGADLLEVPPQELAAMVAAYNSGDWSGLQALENDAAAACVWPGDEASSHAVPHSAGTAGGSESSASSSSMPSGASSASSPPSMGARVDWDAVPHLRPDVVPVPLMASSTPYMRRDIVIWGDCVKLRYGLSPSDSPWLWRHMATYVRRMARVFQALRVDNAHGTPLHVAAAMIDTAREVRPSLYVNAELFTGSLDRDVEYVSRLGINSLVREAMQAGDTRDLVRCVYSYGGSPVASLRPPLRGGSAAARIEALLGAKASSSLMMGSTLIHGVSNGGLRPISTSGSFTFSHGMSMSRGLIGSASTDSLSPGAGHGRGPRFTSRLNQLACFINGFNIAALQAADLDGQYHRGLAFEHGSTPVQQHGVDTLLLSATSGHHKASTSWGGASGYSGIFGSSSSAFPQLLDVYSTSGQPGQSLNTPASARSIRSIKAAGGVDQQHSGVGGSAKGQRSLMHINEAAVAEVLPATLPALFFDCTHDNPTPHEKRHPVDAIASLAIASAAVCAGGTSRGFDILVPENLSVVTDHRLYEDSPSKLSEMLHQWMQPSFGGMLAGQSSAPPPSVAPCIGPAGSRFAVDMSAGIRLVRRRLNALKQEMAARGHTEIYAQADSAPNGADIVTVVRGHPSLPTSYLFIARTAFSRFAGDARGWSGDLPQIRVEGRVTGVVMASSAYVPHQDVRTRAPKGKRLLYPSLLDPSHDANRLAHGQQPDCTGPRFAARPTWGGGAGSTSTNGPASHPEPGVWDADPMLITGLRCDLQYWDDCMPHPMSADSGGGGGGQGSGRDVTDLPAHLASASLGLATYWEEQVTHDASGGTGSGHVVTHVKLDPSRFCPGSVLVVKVRAPRNVAIRSAQVVTTHHTAASAPAATTVAGTTAILPQQPDAPTTPGRPTSAGGVGVHFLSPSHGVVVTTPSQRVRSLSRGDSVSLLLHGSPQPDMQLQLSHRQHEAVVHSDAVGAVSARQLAMQKGALARRLNTFYGPTLAELHDSLITNPAVSLTALNVLLYRCNAEERDDSYGSRGVYDLPSLGPLSWAGLAGLQQHLRHCRRWNDMGHPVLDNVRKGPWLMDYITGRLGDVPALSGVKSWLETHFAILKGMPAGLRPQGFDRVVTAAYHAAIAACLARMRGKLVPPSHYHSQHYLVTVPSDVAAGRSKAESAYYRGEQGEVDPDDEQDDDEDGEAGGDAAAIVPATTPMSPVPRPVRMRGNFGLTVVEGHTDPSAPLPMVTALAMTSVMLWGQTRSAPLLGLPLLEPPALPSSSQRHLHLEDEGQPGHDDGGSHKPHGSRAAELVTASASLAAGLEHFATGYMRNWGRDTFISMRGLLLVTGRFQEARTTLLAFATVLRHGLMPNLMDGGRNPRFNCRDAAWWYLQALQDYCAMSPEGTAILSARVHRRFPSDVQEHYDGQGIYLGPGAAAGAAGGGHDADTPHHWHSCTLADVVQEIMQKHAGGILFREWNAGLRIDAHMRDEGFEVRVSIDPATGVIYGGNLHNCGTWMDKMGSAPGLNDGEPATPRDGADVEIVAMVYSTAKWLAGLAASGNPHFSCSSVQLADGSRLSYGDWAGRLKASFENHFWVPIDPGQDRSYRINTSQVNRRGIYKDTCGGQREWADYQLRPNQVVAMAVAPDLFDPSHAAAALLTIERQLLGDRQLGVKTLDPSDWAYRGSYDNSAEGEKSTAKGWNYHQGPEWLWPYGYYLRARMHFPPPLGSAPGHSNSSNDLASPADSPTHAWPSFNAMRRWVYARLANHRHHLETSPDGGLPELTNADGSHCKDSCTVQAWSSSTLLDALYDLHCHWQTAFGPTG